MPTPSIPASVCVRMVDVAAQSCRPAAPAAAPPEPNWDALAVSLTSQSNAIAWGAVILAIIVAVAGIAWGKIITMNAEQEAREMAEKEVKKWLQDVGLPMILRDVNEFLQAFPREQPISEDDIAEMVAAAGSDREEGDDDGQK